MNFANIPLAEHKHFTTYLKTQSTASAPSGSSLVKLAYFFSFLNWDWCLFKYFLNIQLPKAHRKWIDFIMLLLSVKDKNYSLESTWLSLGSWPFCLAFILSHVLPISSATVEQTGSKHSVLLHGWLMQLMQEAVSLHLCSLHHHQLVSCTRHTPCILVIQWFST